MRSQPRAAFVAAFLAAVPGIAFAQDGLLTLGAGGGIDISSGEPANDITATGGHLRWRLDERWSVVLSADRTTFDFERPAAILGLQQDRALDAIDAKAKATVIRLGLQREVLRPGSRLSWLWEVGLGRASPKVPTVSGPLEGGGQFRVRTDAGSETIFHAAGGLRWRFDAHWSAEGLLRADHHQARWRLRDEISGRSGHVGSYRSVGVRAGLAFSF